MLDGTKAHIHAVIDNFSRKILAWTIGAHLDPTRTCEVLVAASRRLDPTGARPTVMADSGVENVNATVDPTLLAASLRRVLAQIEVTESNSMIEAWWRSLKHQWLYVSHAGRRSPRGPCTAAVQDAAHHDSRLSEAKCAR